MYHQLSPDIGNRNQTFMSPTAQQKDSGRSTVSFSSKNWQRLQNSGSKSKIVNDALDLYYDAKDYAERKKKEFILKKLRSYPEAGIGLYGLLSWDSWGTPEDDVYHDFYSDDKNCL